MDRPMMPGFICRLARKKDRVFNGTGQLDLRVKSTHGNRECLGRFAVNKLGAELDGPLVKPVYVYGRRFDRALRERLL